ncbi:hypothetical protein CHLNCDRAFT_144212 [Chlorella variabilis]|uniref:Hemimethylated DNA-binding domain-containing protein n=1 Tax=Chlorella variabilis TaxID=554065 RepID=E1ZC62_CHLVA|nr:hypothetical protein CHLNCDRAFT_144212 [Chlorella variabilis]EFN56754.1 hypothetical protein CHLNCDRAFT_144212 [Chlorella variabilis]|eukprot:XP_005848856.1 hypothetical protein CHLNCDRAFT_144212 [Chlorella variabilis]
MALQGNRERYYETTNSLLDFVLSNREGIPISLAVLYEAVGVRAGLPITLLNVPMHVVCAMEDPGGGGQEAQRWFVDVFGGGRVLDRFEFSQFLQGLGLPGDQFGLEAQAMTPAQCWMRMCRNLLHLHREHAEYGKLKAVALLMAAAAGEGSGKPACQAGGVALLLLPAAANACMALQQHHEAAELLQTLVGGTYQVQQGHAAALHATALRSMLGEIEAAAEAVHPREGQEAVSFVVGQVIRHRRYQYRGVIIGWDPECRASEEWVQQMGVDRLPGGRRQPFYHVLPDPEDRPGQAQTYVAQENVQPEALAAPHAADPGALHPEVGRYFTALAPGGARYLLSDWMRHCFPGG